MLARAPRPESLPTRPSGDHVSGRDPSIATPLQASVHRRLDEITRSGRDTSPGVRAELDSLNVALLAGALRTVLAEHRVDPSGHCPVCHGRRRPFTRRRGALPCRAYLAVQVALDPDRE
ncbi:hypothetical protein, partial [Saccharomonospora saliphila]|uniref:hypothetical protein n=1 Tax=Saccharomonospora saliphila TaxID=369829 RepID=UPI000662ABF5